MDIFRATISCMIRGGSLFLFPLQGGCSHRLLFFSGFESCLFYSFSSSFASAPSFAAKRYPEAAQCLMRMALACDKTGARSSQCKSYLGEWQRYFVPFQVLVLLKSQDNSLGMASCLLLFNMQETDTSLLDTGCIVVHLYSGNALEAWHSFQVR